MQDSLAEHEPGLAPVPVTAPFLRWAGGKRWLVPQLLRLARQHDFRNYHEPFVGGGSVFFALAPKGTAYLSDLNGDLIEVYQQVRDSPEEVASAIAQYQNTAESYYSARAQVPIEPSARAARFIFLNHTSYNGIYRVNLRGEYNVPFGARPSPKIPGLPALQTASRVLAGAVLRSKDFGDALDDVDAGDLVFLDPPYTVAHNNNGFIKYNQHLFSFEDQERLAGRIAEISKRGAYFALTNAAHSSIDTLFSSLGRKIVVTRRNSVGGKSASRGRTEEFLFTNLGEL
nr:MULTISPECIES: Dam family site-specific DNA-(adenine-N6)-methyltransferase [unclassified Salinibacterium]